MEVSAHNAVSMIAAAREGSNSALGRLLDFYRNYLLAVANRHVGNGLRAKIAPSDLVQETLLAAHEQFQGFRGENEAELLAWLRQILWNEAAQAQRMFIRGKRDYRREMPLDAAASPSEQIDLMAKGPSPSGQMAGSERDEELEATIARLPADYQTVVRLRYWGHRSIAQIAETMGRSPDAVRQLWRRAIARLNAELNHESEPSELPGGR